MRTRLHPCVWRDYQIAGIHYDENLADGAGSDSPVHVWGWMVARPGVRLTHYAPPRYVGPRVRRRDGWAMVWRGIVRLVSGR